MSKNLQIKTHNWRRPIQSLRQHSPVSRCELFVQPIPVFTLLWNFCLFLQSKTCIYILKEAFSNFHRMLYFHWFIRNITLSMLRTYARFGIFLGQKVQKIHDFPLSPDTSLFNNFTNQAVFFQIIAQTKTCLPFTIFF